MLQLPEREFSLWRAAYPAAPIYHKLLSDIQVDVAVVGAGITGLTTAYLLKQAGLTAAVVDKDTVGGGTTGRTTGKVSSQHELKYAQLQQRLGLDAARAYAQANQAAVEQVATIIQDEQLDCDWQREDNYVFTTDPERVQQFKLETTVAQILGLPASFETETPLPFAVQGAIKFSGQGRMSAQKYVLGLGRAVDGEGSYVFEHSTVTRIKDGEPGFIKTAQGSVTARHIVIATNVPTLPLAARGAYCLLEYPQESYIVAGRLPAEVPGMYISPDSDHYSILPVTAGGESMILIGGQGHISGLRGNKRARYERLASYAQKHFGVTEVTTIWSDRDYLAYDNLPLVGPVYPWSKNLYVATAFMKWGLSNGTAAAMILRDHIIGRPNSWAAAFDTKRSSPIKAIPRVFAEHVL